MADDDAPPPVLEIRVHGVSGTPPAAILGVDSADVASTPVAGDGLTGFFRAKAGVTPSGPELPAGAVLEAYSWGSLTSSAGGVLGWLRRALWLLLLPFALVNVAAWARPGLSLSGSRRTWAAVLVRVIGLLLTALLISTACEISIDLFAWQCFRSGVPSCPVVPGWADLLANDTLNDTGRRIALAQALPLAVLAGLALLSRTAVLRYEAVRLRPPTSDAAAGHLLAHPDMWHGEQRVKALARVHLTVGLLVVVLHTAWPMWELVRDSGESGRAHAFRAAFWCGCGLAALAVGVAARQTLGQVEYAPPSPTAAPPPDRTARLSQVLPWASLALLALTTVLLWLPLGVLDEDRDLPGVGAGPVVITLAAFACVVALVGVLRSAGVVVLLGLALVGVAAYVIPDDNRARQFALTLLVIGVGGLLLAWRNRRGASPALAWNGSGAAVLAGTAVMVSILYSTGALLFVADRLNGAPAVSALQVRRTTSTTVTEVQLDKGSSLAQGWLDLGQSPPVLYRGLLSTPTADAVAGAVLTRISSQPLTPGELLRVPDGQLGIDHTCVTNGDLRSGVVELPTAAGAEESVVRVGAGPDRVPCGNVLSSPVRLETTTTPAPLVVPLPYVWFAAVLPVMLALAVGTGVWLKVRLGRRAGPALDEQAGKDYADLPERIRRAQLARGRAAFAHRAEATLSWVAAPVIAAALAVAAGSLCNTAPWELPGVRHTDLAGLLRRDADGGLYVGLGLALGIVALGARMRSSDSLRRSVGILWDLTTFFPRAAHPFGPPCYAERVVPEVTARSRWVLDRGGTVVLSGHSQGSTICVAVLMQLLQHPGFDRVRFVSYGSQLRAWFGRVFPDLLGPEHLGGAATSRPSFGTATPDAPSVPWPAPAIPAGTLAARLAVGSGDPRWRNLYRRSDPLGFRVYSDGDASRRGSAGNPVDVYVPEMSLSDGDPAPAVATHSGYPATATYARVVGPWLRQAAPAVTAPPAAAWSSVLAGSAGGATVWLLSVVARPARRSAPPRPDPPRPR